MACRYCDFPAPKSASPVMDLTLARAAVNAYMALLHESRQSRAEVHFFGGEPFFAEEVVHFTVGYAAMRSAELGLSVHFEVTTNGLYSSSRCRWIADHFDTVVLSLDGPAWIQNRNRPTLNGGPSFDVVARNARIFSEGSTNLILRACVTNDTVECMPDTARWIAKEFLPGAVCFETLVPSDASQTVGLEPPDPWEFARQFDLAAEILEARGIEAILSTADLSSCRTSLCPVSKDAIIVSPDGAIAACYLLEEQWRAKGLDMRLGEVDTQGQTFAIDSESLARVRGVNVHSKSLCTDCLCRFHCAGGCHVSHDTSALPGHFDDVCVLSRLVTVARLLRRLGQGELVSAWFADRQALEASVYQRSDLLMAEKAVA